MNINIKTVTVIGGNGTLGKGISGIFASFGNAKVYVIARTLEKAEKATEEAALSVKALAIKENLVAKTYEDLENCILDSDLVFESVSEDFETKSNIHKMINKYAKETCIIATGTSGLSINDLANNYDNKLRKKFLGIHFFNPPYNMTLCEVIPSKYNSDDKEYISSIKKYLETTLFRDVVVVKDQPAFIGNRIGFLFLNEALQYAEKYKSLGGIDYIDSILGCYTGRNMAPLETINFVGLDVHKAIVDNVYSNTTGVERESFMLPEYVNDLIKANKLGLKVNEGLYKKNENGKFVYDIESGEYRDIHQYQFAFKKETIKEFKKANYKEGFDCIKNSDSEESKICMTFLLKYILYSIDLSKKSCEKINDCDIAMANGFNWIPPIALIEVLGGKEEVIKLCNKYLGTSEDYNKILEDIGNSEFSYEKYIKAIN